MPSAERLAGVVAKVRKLRRLATSQNVNEAAAAAAAADRIIQEHRLSEAELDDARAARIDEAPILREGRRRTKWRWHLASIVAEHYDCGLVRSIDGATQSILPAGRPEDIEIVRIVFAWLESEIGRLAGEERERVAARTPQRAASLQRLLQRFSPGTIRAVMRAREAHGLASAFDERAFCLGAVVGINEGLDDSKRAAVATASTTAAMVLASRLAEATELIRASGVAVLESAPTARVAPGSASFDAGLRAGAAIDTGAPARRRIASGAPRPR